MTKSNIDDLRYSAEDRDTVYRVMAERR
ncbi:MAG: hypothetical protein ACJA1I_001497, partial [Zhongshania marina]